MRKKTEMSRERKQKLVVRLVLIALSGSAIITVALTLIGSKLLSRAYENMVKEELKAAAWLLSDTFEYAYSGDWEEGADGTLLKGGSAPGDRILDDAKSSTGMDFSVYYGGTLALTSVTQPNSSRKITGAASADARDKVLGAGQELYERNVAMDSGVYDVYYIPERNSSGKTVGMTAALRDSAEVNTTIRKAVLIMIGVSILVFLAIVGVGVFYARTTSPVLEDITKELEKLAGGRLDVHIPPEYLKRPDELGNISECVVMMGDKLESVIGKAREMTESLLGSSRELETSAGNAVTASRHVTDAIDEISRGAVNQAESVQDAAGNTDNIGEDVDTISGNVEQLGACSERMKQSCEKAMEALEVLITQSGEVRESVGAIGSTISSTNESARTIAGFSEAISSIAAQTNLLALNASIEAARAGEAGRGFAVVASEIGQLAVQSSSSAEQIGSIVDKLLKDSDASVGIMNRLNDNFNEQARHLESTREEMEEMAGNAVSVEESCGVIGARIKELGSAKVSLGSIVADLSAVSEENAASTEETNASMAELNNAFSVISDSAEKLEKLAGELSETMGYFRTAEKED